MTTKMVAVIHPTGDCTLQGLDTSLESLQGVVGGPIEPITGEGGWHGYVDEDGKLKRKPINVTATEIATRLGWGGPQWGDFIAGTLVLFGDAGSGEGDLPESVVKVITAYYEELDRTV